HRESMAGQPSSLVSPRDRRTYRLHASRGTSLLWLLRLARYSSHEFFCRACWSCYVCPCRYSRLPHWNPGEHSASHRTSNLVASLIGQTWISSPRLFYFATILRTVTALLPRGVCFNFGCGRIDSRGRRINNRKRFCLIGSDSIKKSLRGA